MHQHAAQMFVSAQTVHNGLSVGSMLALSEQALPWPYRAHPSSPYQAFIGPTRKCWLGRLNNTACDSCPDNELERLRSIVCVCVFIV